MFGVGQLLQFYLISSPMSSLKAHNIPVSFSWARLMSSHPFVPHFSFCLGRLHPLLIMSCLLYKTKFKCQAFHEALPDGFSYSFFPLNFHNSPLYSSYAQHTLLCIICMLFLLLENMSNFLCTFSSLLFLCQPLHKALRRECVWCSQLCMQ